MGGGPQLWKPEAPIQSKRIERKSRQPSDGKDRLTPVTYIRPAEILLLRHIRVQGEGGGVTLMEESWCLEKLRPEEVT